MLSTLLDHDAKSQAGVQGLQQLSKSMQDRGEAKPLVVFHVSGMNDVDTKIRADRIESAARGLGMDAHVLTMK